MKRVLSMLVVVGLMVLLFAPVATAQYYGGGGSTASSTAMSTATPTASATATATATATASATALPKSGGPPLVGLVTLAASVVLISSGVGALVLVRRSVS
jgi:hypothetical protein